MPVTPAVPSAVVAQQQRARAHILVLQCASQFIAQRADHAFERLGGDQRLGEGAARDERRKGKEWNERFAGAAQGLIETRQHALRHVIGSEAVSQAEAWNRIEVADAPQSQALQKNGAILIEPQSIDRQPLERRARLPGCNDPPCRPFRDAEARQSERRAVGIREGRAGWNAKTGEPANEISHEPFFAAVELRNARDVDPETIFLIVSAART